MNIMCIYVTNIDGTEILRMKITLNTIKKEPARMKTYDISENRCLG